MSRFCKKLTALVAALAVPQIPSSHAIERSASVARGPYDLGKLKGICGHVYGRGRPATGSGYRFTFEQMMEDAAGVQPGEGPETRRTRVRHLWLDNQQVFRCTANNFDITEGNLLKYSVSSRSYDFLVHAIEEWQLELNFIDPADQSTVLDYVELELARNVGNSNAATLQEYVWGLRQAGAKHCFELVEPRLCKHAEQGSFAKRGDVIWSAAQREAGQGAIADYNARLRRTPLKPYKPL